MLNIGPHISIAKGFKKAGEEALLVNANTFQFFTRNPRGGKAKALDQKDVDGFQKIVTHPSLKGLPFFLETP
ncbi:MAG: hypothetical protein JJE18_04910 [Eubacteriaceae bacterium]|nr:hypothetical protein [Eubacteriaceae bacterium]